MLAFQSFARGETIVRGTAFLIGPGCSPYHFQGGRVSEDVTKPVCMGCYKFVDGTFRCTLCKWPMCTTPCQNVDWHKEYECPILTEHQVEYTGDKLMYYHITLLRALLLSSRFPAQWAKLQEAVEKRAAEFDAACGILKMTSLARVIETKFHLSLGFVHPKQLAGIFRMFQLDGIFNHLPNERCCTVIYPELLSMAYGCVPNGRYIHRPSADVSEPFTIEFYALEDIEQGEVITRCLDESLLSQGTYQRRRALKEMFVYDCGCSRCIDPTELGTFLSAMICPMEGCAEAGGQVLPLRPLESTSLAVWKCVLCDYRTTQKEVREFLATSTREIVREQRVSQPNLIVRPAMANLVEGVEKILHESETLVVKNHFSLWPLRNVLIDMISGSLPALSPCLRVVYAEKMVEQTQLLIATLHELMPGWFPLKAKTYYQMAKALECLHRTAPQMSEAMLRTKELLELELGSTLAALKKIEHSPQLPGIGDASAMISDMERWTIQLNQQPRAAAKAKGGARSSGKGEGSNKEKQNK